MSIYELSGKLIKTDKLTLTPNANGELETIRATKEEAILASDNNKALTPLSGGAMVDDKINAAMQGALIYRGQWHIDETTTDFSGLNSFRPCAIGNYFEVVAPEGVYITVGGIEWSLGDGLVFVKKCSATEEIKADMILKRDHTDRTDTVYLDKEQTLTNKTINADVNTITDLESDNLKDGVFQTTVRSAELASDTSIASEKAVRTAIDIADTRVDDVTIEQVGSGNTSYIQLKDSGIRIDKLNDDLLSRGATEEKSSIVLVSQTKESEDIIKERSEVATLTNHTIDADDNTIVDLKMTNLATANAEFATTETTEELKKSAKVPSLAKVNELIYASSPGVDDKTIELFDNTSAGGTDHDIRVKDNGLTVAKVADDSLVKGTDETKATAKLMTQVAIENKITSDIVTERSSTVTLANHTIDADDNTISDLKMTNLATANAEFATTETTEELKKSAKLPSLAKVNELIYASSPGVDNSTIELFDNTASGGTDHDIRVKADGINITHLNASSLSLGTDEVKNNAVLPTQEKTKELISAGGDDLTIQANELTKRLEAFGTLNMNPADDALKITHFWFGTLEQYVEQDVENQHPDWYCTITNDTELPINFMGNIYQETKTFTTASNKMALSVKCEAVNYLYIFQDRVYIMPSEYTLDEDGFGITFTKEITAGSVVVATYFQGLPNEKADYLIECAESIIAKITQTGSETLPVYIGENGVPKVITSYQGNSASATKALQDINGKQIDTTYQEKLVSGTNIKTVNNVSLVGSGNVELNVLPSQEGQNGTLLTTNGTNASWTNVKTVNATSLLGSGDIEVQSTLVSGSNIKTVNDTSLLGSGNVSVQPTLVSGTNIKTINNVSLLGSGNISTTQTTAVTQAQSDNSTNIATTAFVKNNIQLVTSAPTSYVEGVLYCVPV